MVGATGAVDAGSAAKFGGKRDHGLAPRGPHIAFGRSQRFVQRAKQLRQPALRDAFVEMGIPAVEGECADPRPIGLRQELRSGPCRLHRRIERKEVIKIKRRQLAIQRQRIVAAQREPIWPAPGRSRSASSAPRGSAAIAAIVSPTGPKPNLWRPSAAAVFRNSARSLHSWNRLEHVSRPARHQQTFILAKVVVWKGKKWRQNITIRSSMTVAGERLAALKAQP